MEYRCVWQYCYSKSYALHMIRRWNVKGRGWPTISWVRSKKIGSFKKQQVGNVWRNILETGWFHLLVNSPPLVFIEHERLRTRRPYFSLPIIHGDDGSLKLFLTKQRVVEGGYIKGFKGWWGWVDTFCLPVKHCFSCEVYKDSLSYVRRFFCVLKLLRDWELS